MRLSFYRDVAVVNEKHQVFLVQQVETGHFFVKKTMDLYERDVFFQLRRAKIAGIAAIVDWIEEEGKAYLIEPYISGQSLEEMLQERNRLPEEEAVDYILQLCRILQSLHQLCPPIIHRDIKPSNVMVTEEKKVYLLDFHAARQAKAMQKQDTVLLGTDGYAAPEQYGFSSSGPAADLYGVGVLFHRLLAGSMPKEAAYCGPYQKILQKCLQMDPSKRYTSAKKLEQALLAVASRKDGIGQKEQIEQIEQMEQKQWWKIPGLWSKHIGVRIGAAIWYLLLLLMVGVAELETGSLAKVIYSKISLFCFLFLLTLWFGNYQTVWKQFPFSKSKRRWVRLVGVFFWGWVWMIALAFTIAVGVDFLP